MKIGIITLPLQYNYGGILQAYALQTILERMGHKVEIIQQSQIKDMPSMAWLRYTKRFFLSIIHKYDTKVFLEKRHNEEFPLLTAKTRHFIDKYMHLRIIQNHAEIKEAMFDAFVVGSDQVWRSGYTPSVLPFFLNFTNGWKVKRIAYAASFGLDKWPILSSETPECVRLASMFDAVSVREKSGVPICKEILKLDVTHVLDPTMLLSNNDYTRLIEDAYNEKCLTTYTLDETSEKMRIIDAIKNEQDLTQYKLFTKEHNNVQPLASIEEWLNAFKKSGFVFTDSFHGTVFSIIFNKQFVVFANEHRGTSRMTSLLSLFGLKNRLVHSYEDYLNIKNEVIDYDGVNIKLDSLRQKSLEFLQEALLK